MDLATPDRVQRFEQEARAASALNLLQSAENFYFVAESVRMRYAYAVGRRGDARAAGLAAEAEKIARAKGEAGNQTPVLSLLVELAAAAALRKDAEEALTWVERAFDAGYRDYGLLELELSTGAPNAVDFRRGTMASSS
jgi:hypothetical protein